MSRFNQSNFESAAISLIIDLSNTFAPGDADFITEFCFPGVGNFAHECGGFALMDEQAPTVEGSLGGISFAQWTGMGKNGRRRPFMDLCKELHLHPYSYDAAWQMIKREMTGPEKRVFGKTRGAVVGSNTPKPRDIMMARVVAFELSYERAGAKHYPSRYQWANRVRTAFINWFDAGMPPLPAYQSVPGTMSAAFDRAFGRPSTPTAPGVGKLLDKRTVRALNADKGTPMALLDAVQDVPKSYAALPPAKPLTIAPADPEPVVDDSGMPPVRSTAGRWPEQNLSAAEIRAVQQRLRDCGWVQVGKIDGSWGETYTVPAVKAFQAKAGIEPDGHYGPDTRAALVAGVRFDPPAARAEATAGKLIAAGEPTTKAAKSIKSTSLWTGISGAGAVVFSAVSQFAGDAWGVVTGIKDQFQDVPLWVWGAAVIAIAVFLYVKAQKVENQRVAEEKSGANTALAVPLPATPDPAPWRGQLPPRPADGYQPGNDGTGMPVALPTTGTGAMPPRGDV